MRVSQHPIQAWLKTVGRITRSFVIFIVMMILMTIISTFAWDASLNKRVYNCSDGGAGEYLDADGWVGAHGTYPVIEVDRVAPFIEMGHPDMIKKGWSVARLWYVWDSFFITSLAVSFTTAWIPWVRGPQSEPIIA